MSQAEASQVGADAASLIGRIDVPTVGTRPAGPGSQLIVLVGAVGGLLAGLGLLVLTTPIPGTQSETGSEGPEVVVVVEPSRSLEVPQMGAGEASSTARRKEPTRPSALPRPPRPVESELLTSLHENLRMPETDFALDDTSGMTLKEALQRIGSA